MTLSSEKKKGEGINKKNCTNFITKSRLPKEKQPVMDDVPVCCFKSPFRYLVCHNHQFADSSLLTSDLLKRHGKKHRQDCASFFSDIDLVNEPSPFFSASLKYTYV